MKAIIMAGGEGQRLRPITCTMPKPLVPLLNKPVIDYCVDLLKASGIDDIIVTTHYLPKKLIEHLGDGSNYGVKIRHVVEDKPLGTAGSVRAAVGMDNNDTILVISGDAITDIDLRSAIKNHDELGMRATIVLKRVALPTEYGVALLDKNGCITRFLEKPPQNEVFSDLANTGIYILEKDVLDLIPENMPFDFSKDLFPKLMAENIPIHGHISDGYWCDIGDMKQYLSAQIDMLDRKCDFKTAAIYDNGIYVEPGARISADAKLLSPCYVSSGAQIGSLACIGPNAVICSDARIGEGSSIKRSIVMSGASIREGTELRGAIICENAVVDENVLALENSVVGAKTHIGRGSTIYPNSWIWPEKNMEPGTDCSDNIVWGEGKRLAFASAGITAYADTELCPESAVRLGAAFCDSMKLSTVAVASDGRLQCAMLQAAFISGCLSQGCDVHKINSVSRSVCRYGVKNFGLDGGVYIHGSDSASHKVTIEFFDKNGKTISPASIRKLLQSFERGEKRPVTSTQIGITYDCSSAVLAYEAELSRYVGRDKLMGKGGTVLISASADITNTAALVLLKLGFNVIAKQNAKDDELYALVNSNNADIGICVHEDGSVFAVNSDGKGINDNMASVIVEVLGEGESVVLSACQPEEYLKFLREKGIDVKTETEQSILNNREPEKLILRLVQLQAENSLSPLVDALPKVAGKENKVGCSWKDVGRVFRSLVETEKQASIELVDGVKIKNDTGWVIVKPNDEFAACRIICGSYNQEYASELCDVYTRRVRDILKKQ